MQSLCMNLIQVTPLTPRSQAILQDSAAKRSRADKPHFRLCALAIRFIF